MKSKLYTVTYLLVCFEILHATDRELLQEFMNSNLSPHRPGEIVISPITSSNESDSTSSGNFSTLPPLPPLPPIPTDAPLPPPQICPKEVNISWQLRPPYTLERNTSDDQPNVDGIFHQVLDFTLDKCCAFYGETKPILRYLDVSSISSALLRNIYNEDVSFVFPVRKDQRLGYSRYYINIMDSPGVVLIQRKPAYSIKRADQLFTAILSAWPIVVLSLLMSCLAGICIWMLVSLRVSRK